ncbi:hypothetical protein ACQKQD_32360 [Methylobacterium sp. NPDC080182]|uniref:hypothetical protein n=1 Tax=Methylobacterium sp. NPDC080182 TaxID=3390590 RepID=UPI003CFD9E2D
MAEPKHYNPAFDEIVKAVGRVACMYSDVEFHISETIWMLMNVERQIGACLIAQSVGPGPRFRALRSLLAVREAPDEVIKATREMGERVGRIAAKRNRVVHDPWSRDADGSFHRVQITADNKLEFGFEIETVDGLNELYDEIVQVRWDLHQLRALILREVPPWPHTRFDSSPGIGSLLGDG